MSFVLFALIKAAIVFGGTLVPSLVVALSVQRAPFGARLIGPPPRAITAS
jgi:hypothetical protein